MKAMTIRFLICANFLVFLMGSLAQASQGQADVFRTINEVEWSPDGTELALLSAGELQVFDQSLQLNRSIPTEAQVSLRWSPDGNSLAVGRQIFDAQTLEFIIEIESEAYIFNWTNDSNAVVSLHLLGEGNGVNLGLYDAVNGRLLESIPGLVNYRDVIDISPNYSQLLLQGSTPNFTLFTRQGDLLGTLPPYIGAPTWSNDSSRIAGTEMKSVEVGTENSVLTANGAALISMNIWNTVNVQLLHAFTGLQEYPSSLRWSPDGRYLVGASATGLIYIWDVVNYQQVEVLSDFGRIRDFDFSPFGGRIVVARIENEYDSDANIPDSLTTSRTTATMLNGAVQIIVPTPSLERLQSIADLCIASQSTRDNLIIGLTESNLDEFATQVRAASDVDISPGCAADLLAVAEAIQ